MDSRLLNLTFLFLCFVSLSSLNKNLKTNFSKSKTTEEDPEEDITFEEVTMRSPSCYPQITDKLTVSPFYLNSSLGTVWFTAKGGNITLLLSRDREMTSLTYKIQIADEKNESTVYAEDGKILCTNNQELGVYGVYDFMIRMDGNGISLNMDYDGSWDCGVDGSILSSTNYLGVIRGDNTDLCDLEVDVEYIPEPVGSLNLSKTAR
jgi:hypothetical protein